MNEQSAPHETNVGNLLFSLFNEIGIISQLSSSVFEKSLPEGMTQAQFNVLNWFMRVDTIATPGRLATAFQVTPGAMTNTLRKLEQKELITVEPDPSSGRKKQVRITSKGKDARSKALESAYPLFQSLAEAIDIEKLPRQIDDLREIRAYLDEQRFVGQKE